MAVNKRQITERPHEEMRRSTCANCPCGCGVKVFVDDGRVIDIFGDEEHPTNKGSFCPKGLLSYRHYSHPDRLLSPLLRRDRRAEFQPASWSEAIAFAAERLHSASGKLGKDSCFVHGRPSSPFGHVLGGTVFAQKYGTPNGPLSFIPNAYSAEGPMTQMFGLPAAQLIMNPPRDWCNSRCIVVFACDPATTDPMMMGPILDARDRGTTIVVIDTKTTVTATKAHYALRVRPGSLATVMKGLLSLLFAHGWTDHRFVREAVRGADRLQAELRGFDAAFVAATCDIPEAELRTVAEVIGTASPVQVISGGWYGQEEQGAEGLRMCGALVALRGSIGIPGGGLNLLNASPFAAPEAFGIDAHDAGVLSRLGALLTGETGRVGSLILEGDPCARLPGGSAAIRGLAEIPFIASLAAYRNATTQHADVVFPMASWLESDGLLANGNGRSLQWHNRIVPPPGECRSPIEFWTDLSQAAGVAAGLPWYGTPRETWDRSAANWALANNPMTRAVTVELLDPEANPPGGILWPCKDASQIGFENSRFSRGDVRGFNILFQKHQNFHDTGRRFPTSDGLIALAETGETSDASADAADDSLVLVSSVTVDHVEGYSAAISDRTLFAPRVRFLIHPQTASAQGLRDGDSALLSNGTDSLQGVVRISDTAAWNCIWCVTAPGAAAVGGGDTVSAWTLCPADYPDSSRQAVRVSIRRIDGNRQKSEASSL